MSRLIQNERKIVKYVSLRVTDSLSETKSFSVLDSTEKDRSVTLRKVLASTADHSVPAGIGGL